jgi:hypothetical protein
MSRPRPQFLISELIALVALCAAGFALLRSMVAPLGVVLLAIVPGFVIERIRGGPGVIGGTISGSLIPPGIAAYFFARAYQDGSRPVAKMVSDVPILGVLFVICLVCSISASTAFYVIDQGLRGSRHDGPSATSPKGGSGP